MSRKPSKPETRIEDYLDVMTGGNAALPQPILRIEFYYAFLAGMTVELPQPILGDEKLLAKICGMEVEAPTYIPGLFPRLYAYMAKKGGQDVQVPDPILRLERYWYDYSAGSPPSEQEYTGAVPVTFVADGTPLLDYLISGNTVQDGTPTPDNPVMPQGTGERTGNLYNINAKDVNNGYVNNALLSQDGTTETWVRAEISEYIPISGDTAYTFNGIGSYNSPCYGLYDENKQLIGAYRYSGAQIIKFTSPNNARYFRFTHIKTETRAMMVEWAYTTSTMPDYEPYGYKIPISSASTTTPVYLGEVESTRQIKKLVLTGEENWDKGTYAFYRVMTGIAAYKPVLCTHYQYYEGASSGAPINSISTGSGGGMAVWIKIQNHDDTTIEQWKSYLAQQYAAGTPVTVWYILANEETAVVNESLMRIGDYADTLSMEQAGVEIPTASGSTTLDVATTVPPSEVYIKYRGEAVATLSALPAEVSSPEETPEEVNPEETEEEENER